MTKFANPPTYIKQLLNEVKPDMRNYLGRGLCYLLKLAAIKKSMNILYETVFVIVHGTCKKCIALPICNNICLYCSVIGNKHTIIHSFMKLYTSYRINPLATWTLVDTWQNIGGVSDQDVIEGSGGMLLRKIYKILISEMAFAAFWESIF